MSVIAWDGKMIAADKQATCSGMRFTTTKMRRLPSGEVLAWTGEQDGGELLAIWYANGADITKWPEFQKDKELWVRLIVANVSVVKFYERQPIAVVVEDAYMAWGSGRDYAMGAMAFGADAEHAVSIASKFDNGCGCGIDMFLLGSNS